MSYATIADVLKRYGPIGSLVGSSDNDITSVDVASIYISDSESFIDAHLASRYIVPVTTEPLVTQLSADIAIFNMLADRNGRVPEFMQSRYDRSLAVLQKLNEGTMLLTAADTELVSSGDSEAFSTTGSYHGIFSPVLHEADQKVDSGWVCDDLADRGIDC